MKSISAAEKFTEREKNIKCHFKIHFVYFTETPCMKAKYEHALKWDGELRKYPFHSFLQYP